MQMRLAAGFVLALSLCQAQAAEVETQRMGSSRVALANPHDLKLSPDGRYLLVSDVDNNRVAILDPHTLDEMGSFGADHQSGTHDVDFDAEGHVYVADTHNNRVTIYTLQDTRARLVGTLESSLRGPEGVLAHPNGRIYVAGAWSGTVVAYARDGGQARVVAELRGLSSPHDLELAANGDIWLADAGNDRLLLLSPELEIKRVLEGPPYEFDGVRYLDLSADGSLVVADKNNHQIKVIGADGELLAVLGDGRADDGPDGFRTPEGIELGDGLLWISDSGNDRILKYRFHIRSTTR
ncbi:MAG: NHL repeat-containing protein [Gammaproteobacteria bacterium]|nr:NHL repeat-containing protein [Gammaproteobacteria bacterium]